MGDEATEKEVIHSWKTGSSGVTSTEGRKLLGGRCWHMGQDTSPGTRRGSTQRGIREPLWRLERVCVCVCVHAHMCMCVRTWWKWDPGLLPHSSSSQTREPYSLRAGGKQISEEGKTRVYICICLYTDQPPFIVFHFPALHRYWWFFFFSILKVCDIHVLSNDG